VDNILHFSIMTGNAAKHFLWLWRDSFI